MSRTVRLLLLSSILVLLHHIRCADADPPYWNCSSSANYTDNSSFQTNLNNLLLSLYSNSSLSNFYNTSIGNDTDEVHGLFLCYGFVTLDVCSNCISDAYQDILRLCPNTKEAVVWEEYCQLRYSNQRFFSLVEYTGNIPLWNKKNISEPEKFSSAVKDMLDTLTEQAAFDSSARMYATGETNFTKIDKIYGLVQCTPSLPEISCNRCLETAMTEILSCCYYFRGARLLSRSCYLRYELYAFYQGATESDAPPLPQSIPTRNRSGTANIALIVIGTLVSAIVLVTLFSSCNYYLWGRRKTQKGKDQLKPQELPLIDLATINEATENFSDSNKLGEGGFGPVYKGMLPNGKEVAVKRLSVNSEQGSEEFMNEVLLIMKLQHINLVRLLGCCIEGEEKMLVYEYMPNSSLDVFLFDQRRSAQLDWKARLSIIGGIARGILYLHEDSRLRIIHRDLKASNVLLDWDMKPKISDFGMARIFGGNQNEANTARIVGTYGYMAPEYAMEGIYSVKSDVFSFGVLLLEIVTGKSNTGFHLSNRAPSLPEYASRLWNEGRGLELMDPLIMESCCSTEFLRCIHIGLLCVQEDAIDRPTMSSVVVMLRGESVALSEPRQPPFSVGRFTVQPNQFSTSSAGYSRSELTISSVLPR